MKSQIVIDGATGYLGNHLCYALREQEMKVLAIVRPEAHAKDVEFLSSIGVNILRADLDLNSQSLVESIRNSQIFVHLIGSIAPKKGEKLSHLHAGMTQAAVDLCKIAGIKKVLMVTALGTEENAKSIYHRTKWQAEKIIKDSGLSFQIFRPSLIIGKSVGRRDSKLIRRYIDLIENRPRIPVLNEGKAKIQPVYIMDLVEAIVCAILRDEESLNNQIFEIGGSQVISLRELLDLLMETLGIFKPIQNIPSNIANMLASICELFQTVPVLSKDQVCLSAEDNVCRDNSLEKVFGIKAKCILKSLADYACDREAGSSMVAKNFTLRK